MPPELTQQELLNLFLRYLQIPEPSLRPPSFLDIVHRGRDENMLSNILAYFAQSTNPHGFGCLLANAFLHLVAPQKNQTTQADVLREYATGHGRLDLVIRTDDATIGIEHKIDAGLYNDLEDYRNTLLADFGEPVYCMVLSVRKLDTRNPHWISVTYNRLWQQVRSQLGLCLNSHNLRHLPQLMSVIEHTEQLNMNTDLNEKERFLLENYAQFSQMASAVNNLERKFHCKAQQVYPLYKQAVEDDEVLSSQIRCWYYRKSFPDGCLVFEVAAISCACDFRLSCAGVQLSLLPRNAVGRDHYNALRPYLNILHEDENRYYLVEISCADYNRFDDASMATLRTQVFSVLTAICRYIAAAGAVQ